MLNSHMILSNTFGKADRGCSCHAAVELFQTSDLHTMRLLKPPLTPTDTPTAVSTTHLPASKDWQLLLRQLRLLAELLLYLLLRRLLLALLLLPLQQFLLLLSIKPDKPV